MQEKFHFDIDISISLSSTVRCITLNKQLSIFVYIHVDNVNSPKQISKGNLCNENFIFHIYKQWKFVSTSIVFLRESRNKLGL